MTEGQYESRDKRGREREKGAHRGEVDEGRGEVKRMEAEEVAEVRAQAEDQGWKFERD